MLKIKNEKALRNKLTKQAQLLDWDTLAYEIILTSVAISTEENSNYLRLLEIKLEIWEQTKSDKVSDCFSMEQFLNKEYEYLEADSFE